MFRRSIAYLACVSALSLPFAISAQDADPAPRDEFIMNAWSDPLDCNINNAKPVLFSDLATDVQELLGECVAVEGYWTGRALFKSAKQANMRLSNVTRRLNGKRVGLYAQWEQVGEPPDEPTLKVIVGRVGQCETQWPGAMMVMGYCHYTGGPILLVSQVRSA
ncbi:hypothetical protein OAS19_05540 [Altererythrobacter sp.]|nr:hypothetical protein [Altererythrobacter sp.]